MTDKAGARVRFINRKRREFFAGAEMTSRHIAELLSLLDLLPFGLYRAVIECARARNRCCTRRRRPSHAVAARAITACGELFELAEGVPMQLLPESSHPAG